MTICYPDTMTVKRDIQRRIEDYVNQYCRALEENFKQYSLRSFERNIVENRFPENTKYYQDRIEDYVNQYCRALEENFKQYSINSYKRNIESPTSATVGHKSYYEEQLQKIEDGTANLYKFDYQVGKKYIKVFNLQYEEANEYYGRKAGYRQGSVTAFVDKNTGEVYKPASWKAPAKIVRYDLRIIAERNYLLNPKNCDWAGGHLYLR